MMRGKTSRHQSFGARRERKVDFSVKISNDAGKKFDTNSLVARFKNLPVQTEMKDGADVLAANAMIAHFEEKNLAVFD